MRSRNVSNDIRTKPSSTIRACWTLRTWSRRSELDVAAEPFLVAEIRDAGADGAGGRGAARLRGDPVPDQRTAHRQSRDKRPAGLSRLYGSGVQQPEIRRARL